MPQPLSLLLVAFGTDVQYGNEPAIVSYRVVVERTADYASGPSDDDGHDDQQKYLQDVLLKMVINGLIGHYHIVPFSLDQSMFASLRESAGKPSDPH